MQIDKLFLQTNLDRIALSQALRAVLLDHQIEATAISHTLSGAPQVEFQGRQLYDATDPLGEARREVAALQGDEKADVVVLFGLGMGYHAELCERRFSAPLVVYDPSLDLIGTALGTRTLAVSRTTVVNTYADLLSELQSRLLFKDRKVIVAAIPSYQALFPTEFGVFKQIIEQALQNSRVIDETLAHRIQEWIRAAAKNIPRAVDSPTLERLKGRFAGKPGILISPGPSLDRNIRHLQDAKDRALLVATNSAVHPLHRAGIVPEMVVALESLDLRPQFADVPWLDQIALVLGLNCFTPLYELPAKYRLPLVDQTVACGDWLVDTMGWHRFPSGGSVACAIFSVLYELGCDPIVLVGQDLAYSKNECYAEGATYGKLRLTYDEQNKRFDAEERSAAREALLQTTGLNPGVQMGAISVDAWGGQGMVQTTKTFDLYRSWFAGAAETWAADRRLINATEGGAHIAGFEELSLSAAIEECCREPVPAMQVIDQSLAGFRRPDTAPLTEQIRDDLSSIEHTRKIAQKATRGTDRALKAITAGKIESAQEALDKLEQVELELGSSAKEVRALDSFVAGEVSRLRLNREADQDADPLKQAQKSLKRSKRLFQVIIDGAIALTTMFEEIIQTIDKSETDSAADEA